MHTDSEARRHGRHTAEKDATDPRQSMGDQLVVHTQRDGTRVLVTCQGEIDLATCDQLYYCVIGCVTDRRTRRIQIDLAGVTFLSAAGLRSLLRLYEAAQERGKTIGFDRIPPLVQLVLAVTGFDQHVRSAEPDTCGSP
ncbi:MAG: STAS domain-containing protein [Pseudonocardia sp.]|nr:STAS domain-containing protein [Pseudonocardia sp.]